MGPWPPPLIDRWRSRIRWTPMRTQVRCPWVLPGSSSDYRFTSVSAPSRRRRWQPTPVPLPGESHGWRSLVGCRHGVAQRRTRLSDLAAAQVVSRNPVLPWARASRHKESGLTHVHCQGGPPPHSEGLKLSFTCWVTSLFCLQIQPGILGQLYIECRQIWKGGRHTNQNHSNTFGGGLPSSHF